MFCPCCVVILKFLFFLNKKKTARNSTWGIISEVQDEDLVQSKMQKIEEGLKQYYARLYPKEKEIELADGSTGIELIPDESKFKYDNVKFDDFSIRKMILKDSKKNLSAPAYCLSGDKLVLAGSDEILRNILKSLNNDQAKLDIDIKANEGLLYFNSLDLLGLKGFEGDLIIGLNNGNSLEGILR